MLYKFLSFVRAQAIVLLGPHMSKCGEDAFQRSRASWSGMKSSHQSTEFSWNACRLLCLLFHDLAPLASTESGPPKPSGPAYF